MTLSTPSQKHPEASQATSASRHVERPAIRKASAWPSRRSGWRSRGGRARTARGVRESRRRPRARARVEAERPAAIARNAPPPRRVANSSRVDVGPRRPLRCDLGVGAARGRECPNLDATTSSLNASVSETRRLPRASSDARATELPLERVMVRKPEQRSGRAIERRRSIAGARPRIQRFPFAAKRNARSPPEFPEIFKSAAAVFGPRGGWVSDSCRAVPRPNSAASGRREARDARAFGR